MMLGKYDAKLEPGDAGVGVNFAMIYFDFHSKFILHVISVLVSAWSVNVSGIGHHAMLSDFASVCIGLFLEMNDAMLLSLVLPQGYYYELHTGGLTKCHWCDLIN